MSQAGLAHSKVTVAINAPLAAIVGTVKTWYARSVLTGDLEEVADNPKRRCQLLV